jgi:4-amino-4-deoxy-L-arabinose transferase-like glycosyltransferase
MNGHSPEADEGQANGFQRERRRVLLREIPSPMSPQPQRDGAGFLGEAQFRPWDSEVEGEDEEAPGANRAWHRRVWLGLSALIVGGLGEWLLFSEASRTWGLIVIALGIVLAIVAWRDLADRPLLLKPKTHRWRVNWLLALRALGISIAMVLAVDSVLVYLRDPNAIFGLQGVLWVASMALLLLSCARWYPRPSTQADSEELGPPRTRREVLLLVGLVALSLVIHLALLDQIPWRFHFDEGYANIEIMRYYRGPAISLFTTTWFDTSLPSMWFAFAALLMHITGPGLAGVRLGVALVGGLTVLPVYGLARLAWGRLAALLAGFAVSVSAAYVHYSRVSIVNITTAFWWTICFYFLLRGLRSRRPGDFVWAGLAAGTSMYTYYGTRLLPILLLVFLVYMFLFHFRAFIQHMGHFALLVIGFVAGFGPLIGYFIQSPAMWPSRGVYFLTVPAAIPSSWAEWVRDWNILAPLAVKNFLGLSVIGGLDKVYYAPLLLPLEGALLLLGIGLLIWRWRQPASFLVLLWGSSVIMISTLVDISTIPNFAHWAPAFPAIYLALTLPIAVWAGQLLRAPIPARLRMLRVVTGALLIILLGADLAANAYAYLVQYPPRVPGDASLEAVQGRYLASVGTGTYVRIVGNSWQHVYPDIHAMMAPDTHIDNFRNPSRELPLVADPDHDLAFLFYNDMYTYIPLVQSYYPGGKLDPLKTLDGSLVAMSYIVPKAEALSRYGVLATVTDLSGSVVLRTGQVRRVGLIPLGMRFQYPVVAYWSGAFYVDQPESIALSVPGLGDRGTSIQVLGQELQPGVPLAVDGGWIKFSVRVQLDRPQDIHLLLQQDTSPPSEIDNAHLWPTPLGQGLALTAGSQGAHRIDPFIGSGTYGAGRLDDPASQPLGIISVGGNIRWEGEVKTGDGMYAMELRTDGRAQLSVDGNPIAGLCSAPGNFYANTNDAQIQLSAGWHKLRVDFQPTGYYNGLELFWTRPDGVKEIVPSDALRLGPEPRNGAFYLWPQINWPDPPPPIPCGP